MSSDNGSGASKTIDLLPSPDGTLPQGEGLLIDRDWVDLDLLRKWKSESIESIQPDQNVSPTVRHAMGLTRALEERYLWADALCIMQDDTQHSAHELRIMGKIYASAKLTIVAADGDAAQGIAGIKNVSHTRNLSQTVLPFSPNRKIVVKEWDFTMGDRYFDRAWTFQEYALSQRIIMVKEKRFHWMCSTRSIREGFTRQYIEHQDHFRFNGAKSSFVYPDLKFELDTTMSQYNRRTLSVPLDASAGATGILEILSRAFEGGFLYGLPLMYFHAALMWISQTPMKRRLHSGKQQSILPGSRFPSWLWIGWETSLFAFEANDGTLKDSSNATYGLTKWYSHETPTSSDKRAHAFISCKTKRGMFRTARSYRLGHIYKAAVFDKYTKHCGELRLPSEEEWTGLPAESSGQYLTIEHVATCLRFHPNLTKKEKYGVLWVEWGVDGVAYRKAVGEVDKEAWERHDLEDVDLVLG
ncbi:hypothetical protein PG996_009049 [Apiospora saccharicola]|uniref:Heterokaryon incompatibility domain-containing protein n=1 Tax=Apiospora saccharicola TaxID=335842 RepID=A0ABR1UMN9_9PEZI